MDNGPWGIWCRLAAVLSLDFLLISHVSHFDSVYCSVLHKKPASFFLFFLLWESHFYFYQHESLKCPTTLKQTAEPSGRHTHTHKLMSATEAVSTLQLSEYCFGQIEELMSQKITGCPSGTLWQCVCVLQNQISNGCYTLTNVDCGLTYNTYNSENLYLTVIKQ